MSGIILFTFLLFTAINIFYWLYFFVLPSEKKVDQKEPRAISIIICAFNEVENLKTFLPKILNQKNIKFQVVLVNDKSTDETKEYLSGIKNKKLTVLHIESTPDGWNSKKWALKKGIELAEHQNLLFTDADCYPNSQNWAHTFSKKLNSSDVVLGFSPYLKESTIINHFIQYETSITAFSYLGFAHKGIPYMAVGRNFACKKHLHQEFDFKKVEHLQGGDDDLFINQLPKTVKMSTLYSLESQILSVPKKTTKEYIIQKKRHLNVSTSYTVQNKLLIGTYNLSSLMFYLTSILLITNYPLNTLVLSGILLRTSILFCIFGVNCKRTGNSLSYFKVIVLDFIYTFFLWAWGPISIVAKKVRWR